MTDPSGIEDRWVEFYRERCGEAIGRLAERYPDERSLYVDAVELHDHDAALAEALFSEPDRFLHRARAALRGLHDAFDRVNVRLENYPGLLGIGDLRARHLSELVTVEGVVAEVGPVQVALGPATYACERCGSTVRRRRTGLELTAPGYCEECDTEGAFRLRRDRSRYVDLQRVRFEEPDGTPRSIDVYLDDDLVDAADPGGALLATGVLRADRVDSRNRFDLYLDGLSLTEERPPGGLDDDGTGLEDVIESRWEFVVDG